MDHVRSVEVLERGPGHRLTSWEVDVKGCAMRWVEQEDIDAARHRIDYHQVKGDMAVFEGHWQVEELTEETSKVTFSLRFDLGLPMLSPMLDPVAERAIRENARQMLAALGAEAAGDAR
jgi:coenzyme Q-binding protein COQ10